METWRVGASANKRMQRVSSLGTQTKSDCQVAPNRQNKAREGLAVPRRSLV